MPAPSATHLPETLLAEPSFTELEYRQHYLEADRAQWRFGITLYACPNLLFVWFDYLLIGSVPAPLLAAIGSARVVLVGYSVWLWWYLGRARTVRQCDWAMLGWGLLGITTVLVNALSRPRGYYGNYTFETFLVVAFYASMPLPLRLQNLLMLIYLPVALAILLLYKQAPIPLYTFNALVVLPLCVLSGYLISRRIHRYRKSALAGRLKLERQARSDPLTGIANRRAFMDWAAAEVSRHARNGQPMAVMMLDIDHFKAVNDLHGHGVGDQVLREFAARVASLLRRHDQFARLGGEEFGLVLPECPAAEALAAAERIRAQVAGTPFQVAGQALPITVSMGVARLHPQETLIDAALQRADAALYRAKLGGRNLVVAEG